MEEKAVFAGGCFWCTEAVFQRLKGVLSVSPGFTGGHVKNPAYREVVTERTGHAEAVSVVYDTTQVTYLDLLKVFFATHDPTTLNRQGADKGTHYRSAIFYNNSQQLEQAEQMINNLEENNIYHDPIVTELVAFEVFYNAESYHYNYFNQNQDQPYCSYVISPKIDKLNAYFSKLLK